MSVYRKPMTIEELMRRGLHRAAAEHMRAADARSEAARAEHRREQGNDVVDMVEHNGVWMIPEDAR